MDGRDRAAILRLPTPWKHIALQAANGSVEALQELSSYFNSQPPECLVPLLPILRAYLDPKTTPASRSPERTTFITGAKYALTYLSHFLLEASSHRTMHHLIATQIEYSLPWLLFVLRRYVCIYPDDEIISLNEITHLLSAILLASSGLGVDSATSTLKPLHLGSFGQIHPPNARVRFSW
ncbi:hypothetical protein HGRIS_013553 [Hohenbuehelia grisea]|uniref:Uncharacterized protein n=1 Tax=Hohenbuehelia grisea TaxID=104357 RepID=A0ABR3IVT8_9AGAR